MSSSTPPSPHPSLTSSNWHCRELGSGTGLVGLTVAMLFFPAEVVLSDATSHLDILQENLARNLPLLSAKAPFTHVVEYDWSDDKSLANLQPPYDIVLGTDVAYCPELYQPVIKVSRKNKETTPLPLLPPSPTAIPLLEPKPCGLDYPP